VNEQMCSDRSGQRNMSIRTVRSARTRSAQKLILGISVLGLPILSHLTACRTDQSHKERDTGSSKIVFVSDLDGDNEIYVMNNDGTGQVRLTDNEMNDEWPAWSLDGHSEDLPDGA